MSKRVPEEYIYNDGMETISVGPWHVFDLHTHGNQAGSSQPLSVQSHADRRYLARGRNKLTNIL